MSVASFQFWGVTIRYVQHKMMKSTTYKAGQNYMIYLKNKHLTEVIMNTRYTLKPN